MASYLIMGRSVTSAPVLSIHVDAINQDEQVVSEIDVVNAVKAYLMTVPGVTQTVAQKGEWVTTNV